MIFHAGKKIFEERRIMWIAFRMILHRERVGMIAQTKLLDDVVGGAPRFYFATLRESIDRLMM